MADGPEVSGEWVLSGTDESPAALMRRAISHVESLLHRLGPVDATSPATAEGDSAVVRPAPLTEPPTRKPMLTMVPGGRSVGRARAAAI